MLATALKSQANLSKSFQSFFIETMELILTHKGRLNFTQMARCGRSCESRFRQNFKRPFDWLSFNKSFLESTKGRRCQRLHLPKSRANLHRQKAGKRGRPQKFAGKVDLSVGSTKTLLHNVAMVERFIAMSGKRPNMRLNNTDFKELLFYGVRDAA